MPIAPATMNVPAAVPSLRHKMRAKKADIPVWGVADLRLDPNEVGLSGSFTQVVRVFSPPRRGDRIMLCTDGLHGAVSESEIRAVMRKEKSPEQAVSRLIALAIEKGGEDNVTVLVFNL